MAAWKWTDVELGRLLSNASTIPGKALQSAILVAMPAYLKALPGFADGAVLKVVGTTITWVVPTP